MMVNFWEPNSNFLGIIRGRIPGCLKITEIKNGWTNFVFLAETRDAGFVFRFPRTRFFARAIRAEYEATKHIGRFIKTAKQELHFFEDKPFTIHKYVAGEPLSTAFGSMTEKQKQRIADDILEYLTKLQSIPYGGEQFERLSNFLVRLAVATKNRDYDYNTFIELVKRENSDELVLCHGDFNPDNVLVADNRLACVIDYAFTTISTPAADISRMCNRMPEIAKYFDPNPKLVAMYNYVDNNYIEYMKIYHKEVEI